MASTNTDIDTAPNGATAQKIAAVIPYYPFKGIERFVVLCVAGKDDALGRFLDRRFPRCCFVVGADFTISQAF